MLFILALVALTLTGLGTAYAVGGSGADGFFRAVTAKIETALTRQPETKSDELHAARNPQPSAAAMATITVTTNADSGAGSLRQAILDAVTGDTINIDASVGAITLSSVGDNTYGPSALLIDKTLTINGHGAIIERNASVTRLRLFYITSAGNLTLNDVTLQNGKSLGGNGSQVAGGGGAAVGGAIFNRGTLVVNSSTLTNNQVTGGNGGNGSGLGGGGGVGSKAFAVTVASTGLTGVAQISNTASIADDDTHGSDPSPGNNTANDFTPLQCQTISVTAPATNTGTTGLAFSQAFTQTGGLGATNFSTTSTLPTGLTLAANGTLSGTPTQTDTFPLTVTATDANGCTGATSYTLTITCTAPAITTQPTNQTACVSSAATFSVAASGAGLTYQWRKNNSPISGATGSSYTIASVTAVDAASYDVVVTGSCGTVTSSTATLAINSSSSLLAYSHPSPIPLGSSLRVYPTNGPSDINSMVVQSITPATFSGSINVDSQGVVSVNNAGPANDYTITIRATGNCGATTDTTLTLNVVASAPFGFLYTLRDTSGGNNQIFGYRVHETTGALTLLSGFPVNSGGQGSGTAASDYLAIDRANLRLYALNDGSRTISAFAIDPASGALIALPFSPIALPGGITNWTGVKVHPSGSPLLAVAGPASPGGRVASFVMTSTTATAAVNSPYDTGTASPFNSAFSQDGNYFYTGGNSNSSFAAFSVNSATGVLTPLAGSPFSVSHTPTAYATSQSSLLQAACRRA